MGELACNQLYNTLRHFYVVFEWVSIEVLALVTSIFHKTQCLLFSYAKRKPILILNQLPFLGIFTPIRLHRRFPPNWPLVTFFLVCSIIDSNEVVRVIGEASFLFPRPISTACFICMSDYFNKLNTDCAIELA